ncbi:MAG: hypothetical protein LBM04_03370, partial [Opitutaceae bacterium]|nr:hypothetical protein [Opitutaceae bacterium]
GKPPACPGGIALPKSCQSRNISYEYIGNSKRIITRYGILGLNRRTASDLWQCYMQPRWGCVIIIGLLKAGDVIASLGLQ